MKRLLLVFTLLALGPTACIGVSAPGGGRCNEGMCVKITVAEPIRFGEPVTVTITVTSEKDISNLGVSLYHDVDVVVEEPQNIEKGVKDQAFWRGGASWGIDAKANTPLTFTRKVHFPPREGFFLVVANASTPSLHAADSIRIYITREGGKVNPTPKVLPGTPFLVPAASPPPKWTPASTPTRPPYP